MTVRLRRGWEDASHRKAAPRALEPDISPGRRHDVLHDREPKPAAFRTSHWVGAEEPLEETWQIATINTHAVVDGGQDQAVRFDGAREHEDSPGAGVPDGVLGEIFDDDAHEASPQR